MRHRIPAFIARRNAYGRARERLVVAAPNERDKTDDASSPAHAAGVITSDTPLGSPVEYPVATVSSAIADESSQPQHQTRSSRRLAAKVNLTANSSKRSGNDDEDEINDTSSPAQAPGTTTSDTPPGSPEENPVVTNSSAITDESSQPQNQTRSSRRLAAKASVAANSNKRSRNDIKDESPSVGEPSAKKQKDETKAERKERVASERAAKELAALKARQEALRQAFNPVARALQPVLKELAKRSQDELQKDRKSMAEMVVEENLDVEMQQKLLNELKKFEMQLDHERRIGNAELAQLNDRTERRVNSIRDDYITHQKVEFMRTIREAELGPNDEDADLGLGDNIRDRYYDENCIRQPDTEWYTEANKIWDDWVSRTDLQEAKVKAARRRGSTLPPLELPRPLAKELTLDERGVDTLARAAAWREENAKKMKLLAGITMNEDPNKLLSHIPAKCCMPPPPPPPSPPRSQ